MTTKIDSCCNFNATALFLMNETHSSIPANNRVKLIHTYDSLGSVIPAFNDYRHPTNKEAFFNDSSFFVCGVFYDNVKLSDSIFRVAKKKNQFTGIFFISNKDTYEKAIELKESGYIDDFFERDDLSKNIEHIIDEANKVFLAKLLSFYYGKTCMDALKEVSNTFVNMDIDIGIEKYDYIFRSFSKIVLN